MSKNQSPTLRLKALIAASAVIGILLFGVAAPASAVAPASATHSIAHTAVPAQINGAGVCIAALGGSTKAWQVMVFAIGYCPTWSFLNSPWGSGMASWAINTGCRMPWFVWAATGGRSTRC